MPIFRAFPSEPNLLVSSVKQFMFKVLLKTTEHLAGNECVPQLNVVKERCTVKKALSKPVIPGDGGIPNDVSLSRNAAREEG